MFAKASEAVERWRTRLPAFRWGYLLDAVVALALTVVSLPAAEALGQATVLRWPGGGTPPPLPWALGKEDWSAVAIQLGYEVVPMRPAAWLWWLFTAVLIAGLLVRRRWPLPALILATIGCAGHYLNLYPPAGPFYAGASTAAPALQPIDLAVPITLFTLASQARTRLAAAAACGGVLAAAHVLSSVDNAWAPGGFPIAKPGITGLPAVVVAVVVFALSDSVRSHRIRQRALDEAAIRVERERERAALAVAAERTRITRELHDVVAHSLSIMVAQAQAAVAAQHAQPDRSTRAMQEVVGVGRVALTEMRRVLGALRATPVGAEDLAPQPGVEALPALFDRVRAAGNPVRLRVTGEPAALPAGVDLAAYRIVQEALTNTMKHAGRGARAEISIRYREKHIDLEINDDGGDGRPAGQAIEPGNGLRGIAERVNLLGGELTVGTVEGGGFRVRALLPLEPAPAIGTP